MSSKSESTTNNTQEGKRKLLSRGPRIEPKQKFSLENVEKTASTTSVNKESTQVYTSVRVRKSTRNRLNALVHLGRGESVDHIIDILIDEYTDSALVKDEKKAFDLIYETLQKKDK